MFELKKYQTEAIKKLSDFFKDCRDSQDIKSAFSRSISDSYFPERLYRSYQFDGVPYVCVRIPTGGGKTILGAYTVSTIANDYLSQDYPITLW